MATTMAPDPAILPDVLPTDRLRASGRPAPPLSAELRRIPTARNVVAVVGCYVQSLGFIVVAAWLHHPVGYVACFVLMGRSHAMFASLAHEAAHRLLFPNRRVNDWVGRWVLGAPGFVPTDLYRRGHLAHHRDEFGPEEPDLALYAGYPLPSDSVRRKLVRDLVGISGWKNLKGLLRGLRRDFAKKHARRILVVQVLLLAVAVAAGRVELYVFLWFAPWMTVWRVINRLRSIAEHGGMERSKDKRITTHSVRQSWLARFLLVPYNIGWHLAHHVDIAVPWTHLPRLHDELRASGWVDDDLEYPNYRSLWRTLASG
jgi:fatty acid desaturase